jgi:hypothetical protein
MESSIPSSIGQEIDNLLGWLDVGPRRVFAVANIRKIFSVSDTQRTRQGRLFGISADNETARHRVVHGGAATVWLLLAYAQQAEFDVRWTAGASRPDAPRTQGVEDFK